MAKSKKMISKNDIKKYVKEKGEDELLKDDLIEIYTKLYGEKPHRSANKCCVIIIITNKKEVRTCFGIN